MKKLIFLIVVSLSGAAFAQHLPQPDSTSVSLYGSSLVNAEARLVGRGIILGEKPERSGVRALRESNAATASYCGAAAEIVWREVRRETDPEGGTHVFYRQHLVGNNVDAELNGSEIAVHRMPDGRLAVIGGRQFESVHVAGCAAISAAKAVEAARERVLLHRGEYAQHDQPRTMDRTHAARLAQTKLKLVQIDGVFRPAYFTIGEDGSGEPHDVVIDAADERLLAIARSNPGSNCGPDAGSVVTAWGIPVRSGSWRPMKARIATREQGYTHEGVWNPADVPVQLEVYQSIADGSLKCSFEQAYTLVPLKVHPGVDPSPVYNDVIGAGFTPLYGRAAGDALWHTYKTMVTFKAMGRNGWDGNNSVARVVVHYDSIYQDSSTFITQSVYGAPLNSVAINRPSKMYSGAASLDLVAHEWGHGVIYKTANFPLSTANGKQFHEGFADVIAMRVEKGVQPSGFGLEQSSDWTMHEDMARNVPADGYARGAIDDDADGTPGHTWVGPSGSHSFNDRLHRLDGQEDANNPHATANLLNVAYLIMAAGGSTTLPSGLNPVCARLGSGTAGCEAANAMLTGENLGPTKAGSLLFHAIQFTLTSNTTWNDVADRVNEAAFLKYNFCQSGTQFNASGEQRAVRKAFAGIGYPRTPPAADMQCP